MTHRRGIVAALALLALLLGSTAVQAQDGDGWTPEAVQDLVIERSQRYGARPSRVLAVAACETGQTWLPWRTDGRLLRGAHGELGIGQWLAGGAWLQTPHYRQWGYDVRLAYESGDPDAIVWDVDGLAWAFSPAAPSTMSGQWSCAW